MKKRNNFPEWYWSHGLHDANIVSATKKESDWSVDDYSLILKIDCEGALFETNITEIHFYNYKILTSNFDINVLNGGWWLSDELTSKDDGYLLNLTFDTKKCETRNLKIRFQKIKVIRS